MILLSNQKGMQLQMETTPKLPDPMPIPLCHCNNYQQPITLRWQSFYYVARRTCCGHDEPRYFSHCLRFTSKCYWDGKRNIRSKTNLLLSLSKSRLYFPLSESALKSFESPMNIVTVLTLKSFLVTIVPSCC